METILKAEHVTKRYGRNENAVTAVDDLSVEIHEGEFTVILGRSGSGKSTLLHILAGLIRPDHGSVYLRERSVYKMSDSSLTKLRRTETGFVYQFFNLLPSQNVIENIVLPIHLAGRKEDEGYINELLRELRLEDKRYAWINELSGGQQQRAAIARALASRPAVIFADEPTGNLDAKSAEEVIALMHALQKKYSQTLVMVTHDIRIAEQADRVIILEDGRIVSDSINEITSDKTLL
ncbi:MAG: ABC transporter ATP-binding protein [Solobacterium sp.]|nr:ABC transporter ATP-binding protein [Solobacterium sp.]